VLRAVLYGGLILALVACAQGGEDDTSTPDASVVDGGLGGFADADPSVADARFRPIDAGSSAADSAVGGGDGGGLMCTDTSMCTTGQCCFSAGGPGFCVPGMEIQGICLPN
jgi:hypothetical protein